MVDAHRNLYGTIGAGGGVFELTPPDNGAASWNYRVIHVFAGGADGSSVTALLASCGALYGTTSNGGAYRTGTVFKLERVGGSATWREHVLYAFPGGSAGAQPNSLVGMRDGLYGTTTYGGYNCVGPGGQGCGVAFRLTPVTRGGAWSETVLHTFRGGSDGYYPSGLSPYGNRVVVGATCCGGPFNSAGTVFELTGH